MSRKNCKNRSTATAATTAMVNDRCLHAGTDTDNVADGAQASTAEDKVRAALVGNPGSTAVALSLAAGVGRSTAAKILARWDREGTAIRTAGGGQRSPGTWTLAPSDTDSAGVGSAAPIADTAEPPATGGPAHTEPVATDCTDGDNAPDGARAPAEDTTASDRDAPAAEANDTPPTDNHASTGTTTDDGEDPGSDVPDTDGPDTGAPAGNAPAGGAVDMADEAEGASSSEVSDPAPPRRERLPKGALRGLVEDYLAEHPEESFGPAKIGMDLGHSGGAVNNALEKLVTDGYARKTCEAPKRFAHNPATTDTTQ